MTDTFPRLHARTQRFTLGRPRSLRIAPDGAGVWFLQSDAGDDTLHHLWHHDVASGTVTKVVDAAALDRDHTTLTPEERARRERAREGGAGILAFTTDRHGHLAAFVVGGTAFLVDRAGTLVAVATPAAAHDARLSADGRRVVMVVDRAVHVATVPLVDPDAAVPGLAPDARVATTRVVGPEADDPEAVAWGLAEFVAAEEMGRGRGFWIAPDGASLLVARVDEGGVTTTWLADPVHPRTPPRAHRYPFAGTDNAVVDLHLVSLDDRDGVVVARDVRAVTGDRDHYLVAVDWSSDGPALVTWQDRAQRTMTITTLDPGDASLATRREVTGRPWVERVPGTPTWVGDALLTVEARPELGDEGAHALVLDGVVVSPPDVQVRAVVDAGPDRVVVSCTRGDATSIEVLAIDLRDGSVSEVAGGPGVHAAVVGGETVAVTTTTLDATPTTTVRSSMGQRTLPDRAFEPPPGPAVELVSLGPDGLRAGLVVPEGPGPFPVLLDPYGGPHAQRVLQARTMWAVPQWFAREGFAVLVTDNRGTPGRSPAFEHAIAGDFASGVLADQVVALDAAAARDDRLDLSRVAIRGWSFGGYLAALAALRRPDRFRAAIVGAPVTDWRLYDTHYTERYLGHPDEHPEAYTASSLVDPDGELVAATATATPPAMLVIHGLVDDNVLAAHSLRLSRALLAAGRPHRFLPLSGVTHMTPQEVVAANLLTTQLAFLRDAVGT